MTAIRSLADELREKMRQGGEVVSTDETKEEGAVKPGTGEKTAKKKAAKPPPPKLDADLEGLLSAISAFALTGNEKLLIRLDNRTVFLMKQLKVTRSIDMNKLIAYSVDAFLKTHPELIEFIRSTLQTIEL